MKREILIQSYPIKCFTKYLLMMAIRDLDNIKKNNLYLIKQLTYPQASQWDSYLCKTLYLVLQWFAN